MLTPGEFQNFEKAFDWSLPITVSNKKEVFKLWWVGLTWHSSR